MKENEFLKELEKNNISITQEQIDKLNKYKKERLVGAVPYCFYTNP